MTLNLKPEESWFLVQLPDKTIKKISGVDLQVENHDSGYSMLIQRGEDLKYFRLEGKTPRLQSDDLVACTDKDGSRTYKMSGEEFNNMIKLPPPWEAYDNYIHIKNLQPKSISLFKGGSSYDTEMFNLEGDSLGKHQNMVNGYEELIIGFGLKMDYMFNEAYYISILETTDTSKCQSFKYTFAGNSSRDIFHWRPDMSSLQVSSECTNMESMFENNYDFQADLSHWDTSNVTNMYRIFRLNRRSYGPLNETTLNISGWDTGKVQDFSYAFYNANVGDDISGWDTQSATNMGYMFYYGVYQKGDLGNWCVLNITSRPTQFKSSTQITKEPCWGGCPRGENGTITPCPTAISPYYGGIFHVKNHSNRQVTLWDGGNGWSESEKFDMTENSILKPATYLLPNEECLIGVKGDATALFNNLNQEYGSLSPVHIEFLSGTDTSKIHTWAVCFKNGGPASTNYGLEVTIDGLDKLNITSSAISLRGMFEGATNILNNNQDFSSWDVSKVADMSDLFANWYGAPRPTGPVTYGISNWKPLSCINFSDMFYYSGMNDDLSAWRFGNIGYESAGQWNGISLSKMFTRAEFFNGDINDWNVEYVDDFYYMFSYAKAFDQPLDKWDTRRAWRLSGMFSNSVFNQDITMWNTYRAERWDSMFEKNKKISVDMSGMCAASANNTNHFNLDADNLPNSKIPVWGTCPNGQTPQPL